MIFATQAVIEFMPKIRSGVVVNSRRRWRDDHAQFLVLVEKVAAYPAARHGVNVRPQAERLAISPRFLPGDISDFQRDFEVGSRRLDFLGKRGSADGQCDKRGNE